MKLTKIYLLLLSLVGAATCFAQDNNEAPLIDAAKFDPSTLIWFTSPAAKWEEALPVGNGRLGAMVFGKNKEERIQFNEATYWTGGPYSTVVKGAYKALPEIQKLVFEGKFLDAHNLFGRTLMGYPVEQQKYQCLANLYLRFNNEDNIQQYKRWLNLETGITTTTYTANGITYRREVLASAPGQVIAIRLTASKPSSISFQANLQGVRNQTHSNYATDYFRMDGEGNNCLVLTGKSADYMGIKGALKYEARLHAVASGGTVEIKNGIDLVVNNADTVTLYFVAATNFVNYKNVSANAHQRVEACWQQLRNKNYAQVRAAALADYQKLFGRVSFHLENTPVSFLPTNLRQSGIQTSPDPSLAALCSQFARYIMIACSRPGSQPANLQGIWNQDANPMWDAKYTTNINLQMNYWPVQSLNLAECAEPLVQFVKEVADDGSKVAKEHYNCRGWVFHQNSDLWRVAAPMDGPTWGTFTTAGAWLANMLCEHYLYTQDTVYLRSVYPLIKGSALFFTDFLVMHPNGKWLVTNPSNSPENFPLRPGNQPYFDEVTGSVLPGTTICAGSSIDMQILYDLFTFCNKAASTLKTDTAFASGVIAVRNKLAPPQIGKDGMLQEWADDWGQLEDKHRHLSPLYGLYPGNELVNSDLEFVNSYKKLLEERGDKGNGFSRAWKMCLWARLAAGDRCNAIFKGYVKDQCYPQLFAKGGTAMQVDATFGVAAGINEMLLQSHKGYIEILPALPAEWDRLGDVSGLVARGNFEVGLHWEMGHVTQVNILSKAGNVCRLKLPKGARIADNKIEYTTDKQYNTDGTVEFNTIKGKLYIIKLRYE